MAIIDNSFLNSLDGLDNMSSINIALDIYNNDNLINIDGLLNLRNMINSTARIIIGDNERLENLSGLENLNAQTVSVVEIFNNDSLTICASSFLCSFLANGGSSSDIFNNQIGCNSGEEILDNCDEFDFGKLFYEVYLDYNQNGVFDTDEPHYEESWISIDPIGIDIPAMSSGFSYLSYGTYEVSYNQDFTPGWNVIGPDTIDVTLSAAQQEDTVRFGIFPQFIKSQVQVAMFNPVYRCNEFSYVSLFAYNQGTTLPSGTIWLDVDASIIDFDFVDAPDLVEPPSRYGWHFDDLVPGNSTSREIGLLMPGPPIIALGDSIYLNMFVSYDDANGPDTTNTVANVQLVECSYDPNDKQVSPQYPDNYALFDEPLIYTVRFQNTGNAEAFDVVIQDTLSEHLDHYSLKIISNSHPEVFSATLAEERFLTFSFIDINLPDSTTNFAESQGYILYQIMAKENLPEETVIENTASIYFDLNPPIVTNTTTNTMLSTFDFDEDGEWLFTDCDDQNPAAYTGAPEIPNNGVDEDCDGEDLLVGLNDLLESGIRLFPNPAEKNIRLELTQSDTAQLTIMDVTGRILSVVDFQSAVNINLSKWENGVYLFMIQTDKGRMVKRVTKQGL